MIQGGGVWAPELIPAAEGQKVVCTSSPVYHTMGNFVLPVYSSGHLEAVMHCKDPPTLLKENQQSNIVIQS